MFIPTRGKEVEHDSGLFLSPQCEHIYLLERTCILGNQDEIAANSADKYLTCMGTFKHL